MRRTRQTLAAVADQWRRVGNDFDAGWSLIAPSVQRVVNAAQMQAAQAATDYIPEVLAATGQQVRDPEYRLLVRSLVGTAGDGRPTDSLMYGAVTTSKAAIENGAATALALNRGGQFLELAVGTLLSDTRRTAEKVDGASRRVDTWVRALNPPSCGRCVVLAGKKFRTSEAFERHPGCDCTNIPAAESIADDLMVDPHAYLDQLDDDALRKALGSKANAQAFRDGADFNQLINAYRRKGDVMAAQVYGSTIKYTAQGRNVVWTGTRRSGSTYTAGKSTGWSYRYSQGAGERWMPETIYRLAGDDRALALDLLKQYGWIV